MGKSKNVIHTVNNVIYKGMKRQAIIDNIVQYRFKNMDDDILFDILEHGHMGYSESTDDELIEEYQEVCGEDDDDDWDWIHCKVKCDEDDDDDKWDWIHCKGE
jgi:hypothetical protein